MTREEYGFQEHLSSKFPSQIIVDTTQHCNLACIHCPHAEFKKSKYYLGANLDVQLHKKLIDEVASDGYGICQYLRYTANGETLLHPHILKLISYAGKHSRTRINLTTNGMLLSADIASKLLDAGVNVFDISIDAFCAETYRRIRVNGDLNITTKNVLNLLQMIKKQKIETKVVVSFVKQSLNLKESLSFKKYWTEKGADFVVIRELHSAGGAKNQIKEKMNLLINKDLRRPCLYPWERLVLTPTGEVGFCPADWTHGSAIASFKDKTIKEIWRGEEMTALRYAHLSNEYKSHSFCGQCPDWIHTKWPLDGRVYSDMMREIVPVDLVD